jgi:hypothetical protein
MSSIPGTPRTDALCPLDDERSRRRRMRRQSSPRREGTAAAGEGASLWCLALLFSAWWLTMNPMRNADLWWHLASGRWIVEHGAVPRVDPFSFSAHGQRWLNTEWLGDVLFQLWTAAAGLESLVYWLWGILLLTYLLLFLLCTRLGATALTSFLGASLAVAASAPFFEMRPHLYSLLLAVVLLWLLLLRRRLWPGLPVLFVVWANLHPSFVFGLAVVAAALLIRILANAYRRRQVGAGVLGVLAEHRGDMVVAAMCGLATLINPSGLEAHLYPLRYAPGAASPFRELKEWLPPFSPEGVISPLFPGLIALFLVACLVLIRTAGRRVVEPETRWTIVALGGITLFMALSSGRFIPLFAILACLPIALLRRNDPQALRGAPRRGRGAGAAVRVALPLLLTASCLVMLLRYPLGRRAFAHLTSLETFPVETFDFIGTNRLSGRVFAYFGWGGYVQYRTRGRMQVYIDGRADALYSPTLFNDYRRVQYAFPGWIQVVEASGADYFLWPNVETPQVHQIRQPDILLATGRWQKVHEDFVSVLLARAQIELPATVTEEARSANRELALGGLGMRKGDARGAETHLRLALSLDHNSLAACRNLALVLAWQGRARDAWAQHGECQKIFPEAAAGDDLRKLIQSRDLRARR